MFLDELSRILRLKVPAEKRITLAQAETQRVQIAEEAMELERVKLLHQRFAGTEIEQRLTGNPFSDEETIDLGTARDNKLVWNRPFKALYITECKIALPGTDFPVAYVRFNDPASSIYQIRTGFVKGNFSKLYLTNTAQTNCRFKFVIGHTDLADFRMSGDITPLIEEVNALQGLTTERTLADLFDQLTELQRRATEPFLYNVTITNANEEYEQELHVATKAFSVVLADLAAFRIAFVTGKVATPTAPYYTQPANIPFERQGLYLSGKTVYIASPAATKVAQILCWV
ncbi:MAG: hypothetical protein GH144_00025 [Clostridia bacterium]|jgi:hypothetical protein|nr:hypothetical protein [Clostridia bacterium]